MLGREDQSTDSMVDVITEDQLLWGLKSLKPADPSANANGGSSGRQG
jgi:DNA-directed RNA polymerase subunit omega